MGLEIILLEWKLPLEMSSFIKMLSKSACYMLNCKINSTNGGTFCKSAASLFLVFFFWSRGPKLCPNRTGNTKFYKNLTRIHAYMRFPWSHVCPGTSRNKGDFTEKIYTTVSTDRLEQISMDYRFFHASTYTMDVWKNPKIESCYTIFCSKNAEL